jgi:HPr kinase/phosphorylase
MEKFYLNKLVEKFNFEVLAGADKLDSTLINVYGLNRAGLELTGFFAPTSDNSRRVVLVSSKEYNYMHQFDEKTKTKKYEALMKSGIPAIIITQKFKDKTIIATAKKLDFPLLKINYPSTSEISRKVLDYFDDYFAPTTEVHASLVNIFGQGVLINGVSGIGKSEVTIDLVKKNHMFVGDDRIILTNKSNRIYGKSHPILKNLVEVRGIGIMDISLSNGYQVIMDETEVNLVIELFRFDNKSADSTDRLGNEYTTNKILDVDIPVLRIPVSSGRNIANIIESAVAQLKINQSDAKVDVIKLMNERSSTSND